MDAIFKKRCVRKFRDIVVEQEKVEKLIRAGMQAPSAGNQQPWEFIIVDNRDLLNKMAKMGAYLSILESAPLAIILLVNNKNMKFPEYWQQDMAAATENILIEAEILKLGALWIGVAPDKERTRVISDIFDLPSNVSAFSVIPIGYPAEEHESKFIEKYDGAKVRYNKYWFY